MNRAITVAAPFYGYDGQIHRWFEGDAYLNVTLGQDHVIRVISSLPACYTLLYLDYGTYVANEVALNGDPDYPLTDYPSHDAANPVQVDPYTPGPNRYPANTGFDLTELGNGRNMFQQLAAPVPWQ